MSSYALPVLGLSTAGLALVAGVLSLFVGGVDPAVLAVAVGVAFLGVTVAYYGVHNT